VPERDAKAVVAELREKIQSLPRHVISAEPLFILERRFNAAAYDDIQKAVQVDSFFCRVTLSDGSETLVGFWIYPHERGRAATDVTQVILGDESFHSIQGGVVARRNKERLELDSKLYSPIFRKMILNRLMRDEPQSAAVAHDTLQRR
jgi:hypothetical protein